MAAGKEIRTKISSIQSTQKITSAMEMVAASKMRRAQDRMRSTRPYAEKMLEVTAASEGDADVMSQRPDVEARGCCGLDQELIGRSCLELEMMDHDGLRFGRDLFSAARQLVEFLSGDLFG